MKIFDVWPLINGSIFVEYFICMFQKLLLPTCYMVRRDLVSFEKLNDRLVVFHCF